MAGFDLHGDNLRYDPLLFGERRKGQQNCLPMVAIWTAKARAPREDITHLAPQQPAESILEKERRIAEIVGNVKGLLARTK